MKHSRAVPLLRAIALLAMITLAIGGVFGGALSRSPGKVSDLAGYLFSGAGDGFMGLVVIMVLAAPPIAMLTVAIEARRTRRSHLWIALGTMCVLVLTAIVSWVTA